MKTKLKDEAPIIQIGQIPNKRLIPIIVVGGHVVHIPKLIIKVVVFSGCELDCVVVFT
jgi:hypothetical protein